MDLSYLVALLTFSLLLPTSSAAVPCKSSSSSYSPFYYCYLCYGRAPLARKVCPTDVNFCKLFCAPRNSSTPTVARDSASDACYILQLYDDGSYNVQFLDCSLVSYCTLLCDYHATPAVRVWRSDELHSDKGFQRCGDQTILDPAATDHDESHSGESETLPPPIPPTVDDEL